MKFVLFILLLQLFFACHTQNNITEKPTRVDRSVHFSDSITQDHFTAQLVNMNDEHKGLRLEIRNSKDSVIFENTWPLRYWVSVANKVNYIQTQESRIERIDRIFDHCLDDSKFGSVSNYTVTRILDDPNEILKNELKTNKQKPVYSLFYADAVLVYSAALGKVVEINAVEKSLLKKYSIPF